MQLVKASPSHAIFSGSGVQRNISSYIGGDPSLLQHPQLCSFCGERGVGISAYQTGAEFETKIQSVCSTIRRHTSRNLRIGVVTHDGQFQVR